MAEEKRETDKMTLPPTAAEMAAIRKNLGSQRDQELSKTTIVGLVRVTGVFFFAWGQTALRVIIIMEYEILFC